MSVRVAMSVKAIRDGIDDLGGLLLRFSDGDARDLDAAKRDLEKLITKLEQRRGK